MHANEECMIARPIRLLDIVQLILIKLNTDHADINTDSCLKIMSLCYMFCMRFRTYGTHKVLTLQQFAD